MMETAQDSKLPKIALLVLISSIIVLIGFNFALSRYGAFWQKPQPKISPSPPELSKEDFIIGCPVPQDYCQSGKEVYWEGKLVGLEFILPEGTPLLAAFTGEPNRGAGKSEDGTPFEAISLTSREGYKAVYFFQGETETLPFAVRKGEVLTRVSGESISSTREVNFYFSVEKNGESLPITSNSFQ
ncbi:MAG: hypothetical protein H5T64_11100 [Chloroflexi bacterium]|nr:hypothetical protein [Chloroflexota bacterium]